MVVMRSRPRGRKHTLALWMLVAAADGLLVVRASGDATLLLIALAVAVLAGLIVTARLLSRRAQRQPVVTEEAHAWQPVQAETEAPGWRESRA
jgi:hypothetical protein